MIHEIQGNAIDAVLEGAATNPDTKYILVHGCNAQGVMRSGIAKEVRERFPLAYDIYEELYKTYGLPMGSTQYCIITKNLCIVNAITQEYYGRDGKRYMSYDAVQLAFKDIYDKCVKAFSNYEKIVLVFPKIGAGLGGGDWEIIKTIIDQTVPDTITKQVYVM